MPEQTVQDLQAEILRQKIRLEKVTPIGRAMGIAQQGIAEGLAGLAGIPNMMMQPSREYRAVDQDLTKQGFSPEFDAKMRQRRQTSEQRIRAAGERATSRLPTSADALRAIQRTVGPGIQPEEPSGRILKGTMSGAASGVVGGPVGMAGGALSGLGQTSAAEAGLPEWAQILASVGVPVSGALTLKAAAAAFRAAPANILRDALKNATPEQMRLAQEFMDAARAQGVTLTPAESLGAVTGQANQPLLALQRYLEQSRGGGPRLAEAMSRRQGENVAAFDRHMSNVSPNVVAGADRTQVPFHLQDLGSKAMSDIYAARAQATKPVYGLVVNATNDISVPGFAKIQADSVLQNAIKSIRKDPAWEKDIKSVPDNNMIVLDAVKKHLDDEIGSLSGNPGNRNRIRQLESSRDLLVKTMDDEYPDYAQARAVHEQITKDLVIPAQQSPVGALADIDAGKTTDELMRAERNIFTPMNPETTDAVAIRNAANTLQRTDPTALAIWQRVNLEAQFDKAIREMANIQAGEWSGARFALSISGNRKQAENLRALMETLPNGKQTWEGFEAYLEILKAQGFRQRPGSMTEFNRLFTEDVQQGRFPVGLLAPIKQTQNWWNRLRARRNATVLTEMFLDPNGAAAMAKLSGLKPGTQLARFYFGVASSILAEHIAAAEDKREQ